MIQFLKRAQTNKEKTLETDAQKEGANNERIQQEKVRADQKKQADKEAKDRKEETLREQEALRKAARLKKDEEKLETRKADENKKTARTQKVEKEDEDKKLKQKRATEEATRLKDQKEKKEVELAAKRVETLNAQEKLARTKDVISGLRSLSQKGLHNMSAADKEQFMRLAIEYKALSAAGSIQEGAAQDVEGLLKKITGADRAEVDYFLTEDQKARSKKEDEEASKSAKMKWFLSEFRKNPDIIYENVELFEEAVKNGELTADTLVTNANGEKVTVRQYSRDEWDKTLTSLKDIAQTSEENMKIYKEKVALLAVCLCGLTEEEKSTKLAELSEVSPKLSTDVLGVYQSLMQTKEGRELALSMYSKYKGTDVSEQVGTVAEVVTSQTNCAETAASAAGKAKTLTRVTKAIEDEEDRGDMADALPVYLQIINAASEEVTTLDAAPTKPNDSKQTPIAPEQVVPAIEEEAKTNTIIRDQTTIKRPASNRPVMETHDVERLYYFVSAPKSTPSRGMNTLADATRKGPALGSGFGTYVPIDEEDYSFSINHRAKC